jgi:hypothetical protein
MASTSRAEFVLFLATPHAPRTVPPVSLGLGVMLVLACVHCWARDPLVATRYHGWPLNRLLGLR